MEIRIASKKRIKAYRKPRKVQTSKYSDILVSLTQFTLPDECLILSGTPKELKNVRHFFYAQNMQIKKQALMYPCDYQVIRMVTTSPDTIAVYQEIVKF
jgi:hypothetical protein